MATVEMVTSEQLVEMCEHDGIDRELIAGELRVHPPHTPSQGMMMASIGYLLQKHVDTNAAARGTVLLGDCGFRLKRDPDTTVGIDVAFIRAERLSSGSIPDTFLDTVPDLAVEVLSKSQTQEELDERVEMFLQAGVALIWFVNPRLKTLTVIRSRTEMHLLTETGELSGEPVLPGFKCQVAEIFR